ncbi:hypothetical protein AKJ16_DCAP15316, partial [Drosera capensis]
MHRQCDKQTNNHHSTSIASHSLSAPLYSSSSTHQLRTPNQHFPIHLIHSSPVSSHSNMERRRHKLMRLLAQLLFVLLNVLGSVRISKGDEVVSAVGDPGMKRDGLRVAFEAWNFCNEVGNEAPGMGSPRAADCFDLAPPTTSVGGKKKGDRHGHNGPLLNHRVSDDDNKLGVGKPFPGLKQEALADPDLYATQKELYLGLLCQVEDTPNPWQFWMVMLKNGNYDTTSALCPENGKKTGPFPPGRFPCFGKGCMNQPSLSHQPTQLSSDGTLAGSFSGTYDLGSDTSGSLDGISYYEVVWEKEVGNGSW